MRVHSSQPGARIIQSEHDTLAAVIHGMQYFARAIASGANGANSADDKATPPPKIFRAMLLYIREYPDKLHHPKEDRELFARLRARTHRLDAVLDQLEADHGRGDVLIHELEDALTRHELGMAGAMERFCTRVDHYAAFYFAHMKREEDEVLPVAEEVLTAADWSAINEAFAIHSDPLSGIDHQADLDQLLALIVNMTPAPIGLGPAG